MEEARGLAAHCWCHERTSGTVMDVDLAETFAEKLVECCGLAERGGRDNLLAACKSAKQFIENGIEFGYIYLPDSSDPALKTLPAIRAAIAEAEKAVP